MILGDPIPFFGCHILLRWACQQELIDDHRRLHGGGWHRLIDHPKQEKKVCKTKRKTERTAAGLSCHLFGVTALNECFEFLDGANVVEGAFGAFFAKIDCVDHGSIPAE